AASVLAVFIAQRRRERGGVLLPNHRKDALRVRFAGEESQPEAMACTTILDARHLIQAVVFEPRQVLAARGHGRNRGAQVDDVEGRALAKADYRRCWLGAHIQIAGVFFRDFFPIANPPDARGRRNASRWTDSIRRGVRVFACARLKIWSVVALVLSHERPRRSRDCDL